MEALYKQALAILTDYIREHGMRQTIERQIVLLRVCAYRGVFTAEDVIKDVCDTEHISVATIYNTLDLLVQCNLLSRLPAHLGVACVEYELVLLRNNCMRFVCTTCGREVEFRDKAIEDFVYNKRFSNFNTSLFSLSVYGECKKCRRKPKQSKP